MSNTELIQRYIDQVKLPQPDSHKGQNGKLLIIGGSELFHAASKWSLDVASKFVDMVFYSSIPSNNELMQQAKGDFWNGIVISRDEIGNYADEADVILIGPGMERTQETEKFTRDVLQKYPTKKWVIDAGALQMVDPVLVTEKCILTPHTGELERIAQRMTGLELDLGQSVNTFLPRMSQELHNACILLKGSTDYVVQGSTVVPVSGGNAGMTKGGTGDVLAGIVAGLYACTESLAAAVTASYLNKAAGDSLYQSVGPNFNASDLVQEVPKIFWQARQTTN